MEEESDVVFFIFIFLMKFGSHFLMGELLGRKRKGLTATLELTPIVYEKETVVSSLPIRFDPKHRFYFIRLNSPDYACS